MSQKGGMLIFPRDVGVSYRSIRTLLKMQPRNNIGPHGQAALLSAGHVRA